MADLGEQLHVEGINEDDDDDMPQSAKVNLL